MAIQSVMQSISCYIQTGLPRRSDGAATKQRKEALCERSGQKIREYLTLRGPLYPDALGQTAPSALRLSGPAYIFTEQCPFKRTFKSRVTTSSLNAYETLQTKTFVVLS